MNEIIFIPHCEEEYCDMGSAEFECPSCGSYNVQYDDLWWLREDYNNIKVLCDDCNTELIAERNENGQFTIKTKKDE